MSYNGSGSYTAPAADFPAVASTLIESAKYNNVINDIATALSLCITKDGQQTVTANIPLGGYYITNGGIKSINGTVGAPGITFNNEPDCGLYYIGTNNIGMAIAGAKVVDYKADGEILYPKQPCFLAHLSATSSNQTGDGTSYTVICDTETKDQGGDYNNSTGTFTAPVTGTYSLKATVRLTDFAASAGLSQITLTIVTSNRDYQQTITLDRNGLEISLTCTADADMDAADTATVTVSATNAGGKTVDVVGHATNAITRFSGYLAC